MRSAVVYLTNFLLTASLGVVFVFLEDVQRANNLADWEVGVVAATGFGAALATNLALAPLADRGRIAIPTTVALIAGVIGPIGFALGSSLSELALSRGLSGIGVGLFGLMARKALLGLSADGGGAKLGMILSTNVAGFILGPAIGWLFEPLGFAAPFIAVAAAVAVVGIPAASVIVGSAVAMAPVDHADIARLLTRPKVQAAILVQLIVYGYIGIFDSVIDRYLTDLGASTGAVAVVIVFVGGPMLILPRIAGNVAERRGGATVMLPALFGLVPAMAGYGVVPSVAVAALVGMLHGSSESFASISAQVLVLEVTGAERAAVGAAVLDAAGLVAATMGALLAPTIYGAFGRTLFVGAAVIGLVLGLLARLRAAQGLEEPAAQPSIELPRVA